ncbi:MAG: nucleotidyltransferase domain-containing protein [Candidatus Nanoarchaeia archaeon]
MENVLKEIKKLGGEKVEFIILFGSVAQNKSNKFSDIDLAVYYNGDKKQRFNFRLKALGNLPDKYDIRIFQDLPLYVQKEVLRGKVVYARDRGFVYDKAYEVVKRFEDFKKTYYDYINFKKIV